MSSHAQTPYHDQDSTTTKWVVIFVVISLLAHALFILSVVLISRFMPVPKLTVPPPPAPVTLSLIPLPLPPSPPKPKHVFMPTPAQASVPPKETLIESDHDTRLASQTQKARLPDALMPDIVSHDTHPAQLNASPNAPTRPKTEAAPSPPQPKQPPTKVQKAEPPKPTPQPPPPTPPKTPPQTGTKDQVDPNTGLPVLPPIRAETLAQQTPTEQASPDAAPPPSVPVVPADIQGRAGLSGAPTPEAMATDLGRYKAYIYSVVGSYWYPAVDQSFQILPVGMVQIRYTIHYDGTVSDVQVLQGDTPSLQQLMAISRNSIVSPAPFKPFPDALRKKIGDSYTDDFTFSVY